MADYLTYAERPVQYTIATRYLREIARVSENITEPSQWEEVLDLLDNIETRIQELVV